MDNSMLVFGAIAVATILIIINEHLLKRSTVKPEIRPTKKMQVPLGAIEYMDTTYVPITTLFQEKNNTTDFLKGKNLKKESNRLKGTLLFIVMLAAFFYLAA